MRYRQMVAALKQNLEESQKRLRQYWSGVDGPWAAPEATHSAVAVQTTSITSNEFSGEVNWATGYQLVGR